MNEQPNWHEEGGEVLPPNIEPEVPANQPYINRGDLNEMHPNFAPRPTQQPDESTDGPTPLFPENDEELDAAVGRHPANPNPYWPSEEQRRAARNWLPRIRKTLNENKPVDSARSVARDVWQQRRDEELRGRSSQNSDQDPSN